MPHLLTLASDSEYAEKSSHCAGLTLFYGRGGQYVTRTRNTRVHKSDGEHLERILGGFVTRTSLRNDLVVVMYLAVLIEPSSITITLTTTRSAISRLSARSSCPRQCSAFRARILSRHGPIRSITDRFIANSPRTNDSAKIELGRWEIF